MNHPFPHHHKIASMLSVALGLWILLVTPLETAQAQPRATVAPPKVTATVPAHVAPPVAPPSAPPAPKAVPRAIPKPKSVVRPVVPVRRATVVPKVQTGYRALSDSYAKKYGVSASWMWSIVFCESGGNRYAIGDSGRSFGLVQIFMPAHPNITKTQAFDPNFALNYIASNLAAGRASMWTCSRLVR